jgi:hypothetical protein
MIGGFGKNEIWWFSMVDFLLPENKLPKSNFYRGDKNGVCQISDFYRHDKTSTKIDIFMVAIKI